MHFEAAIALRERVADALHEALFGFVIRMLLAGQHDELLALADDHVGLLVRLQVRLDAAGGEQRPEGGCEQPGPRLQMS